MSHTITVDEFRALGIEKFTKVGVTLADARMVTEILLDASLCGYDSHGIMRIPAYIRQIREGKINPHAVPEVKLDTGAIAILDGNFGLGPITVCKAMEIAAKKAEEFGVACVSTQNAGDVARLGSYFAVDCIKEKITIVALNDAGGGAAVVPWGGVAPFFSTNPLAACIPRRNKEPIIIDISSSVTAVGKLKMAGNLNQHVPDGWLIKRDGSSETDPKTFFNGKSALLPLGGLLAGHKGYALSILIESLAGALIGAGCSTGKNEIEGRNNTFILCIDPSKFGTLEAFYKNIENFEKDLKTTERNSSEKEILLPGENSAKTKKKRLKTGIPIDPPTLHLLFSETSGETI